MARRKPTIVRPGSLFKKAVWGMEESVILSVNSSDKRQVRQSWPVAFHIPGGSVAEALTKACLQMRLSKD